MNVKTDWHLQVRLSDGEWHDLGVHECPKDMDPKDYFTLDLKIADEEAQFTWNMVYEVVTE